MGFFERRYEFPVHMFQIFLVLLAVGGSVARLLFLKVPGAPTSRANTMALGMVRFESFLSEIPNINSGCQILNHHPLRSHLRAHGQMGQSESEHDSQLSGGCFLGRGSISGYSGQYELLCGDELHCGLGCVWSCWNSQVYFATNKVNL